MDQKYLAEIKAREQAVTRGPWEVKTNRHPETTGEAWGWIKGPCENWCWTDMRSSSRHDAEFIAHARTDIPALLAEAERLAKENQGLQANSMIQEHIITDGRDPVRDDKIVRLIADNAVKDQQIATLKADKKRAEKALELACRYHRFDDFKTVRSEIEFFAQQAQEQEGHDG